MMKNKTDLHFSLITLMILLTAFSRIIPHPSDFAPIGAMALFGSAYFGKRYIAIILPIITMWISDLVINNYIYSGYFEHFVWFYQGCYWTYGSFALIALAGKALIKKVNVRNVIVGSLSASLIFFLVSNFGAWISTDMYEYSPRGLTTCFLAGIPFLKNTLAGDLVYSGLMFGLFEIAKNRLPKLAKELNSDPLNNHPN